MTQCPSGHASSTTDYCDVCGMPMTAAPAPSAVSSAASVEALQASAPAPSSAGVPAGGATQTCENCKAVNAEANLFCEVCGFDFTTGVMPRVEGGEPSFLTPLSLPDPEPVIEAPDGPLSEPDAPDAPLGAESVAPSDADEEPASSVPSSLDLDSLDAPLSEPSGTEPFGTEPSVAEPTVEPTPAPAEEAREAEPVPDPVRTAPKPVNRPPSREVAGEWVVEVWVDPDWFAVQSTGETCPSPAPPEIVRITGSDALIGRRSRTAVPDIDCGIDSAVSRRQALLSSDGRRWWIEDLDSSNGTWVGPAIGPLPTSPITGRTEVDGDDRIYVGAWTRLVVRPAVDSELT